ncbi:OmpP1/FadL family transporter [Hymenobacter daeguensis]
MKKRIIRLSLALVVGQAGHAFAQGASDALQYSRLQFGGPARTQGIAGANVALGADFGNLTSNPAGLGLYQKSEAHITPGIGLGQSDARIDGNSAAAVNETKNSFHLGSVGLVFATRRPDDDQSSNWRGGAFAMGFSRVADFNTASRYQGSVASNQSYLTSLGGTAGFDYYINIHRQGDSGNYNTVDYGLDGLAYGAYLTDVRRTRIPGSTDSTTTISPRVQRGAIGQSEYVTSKGSISQFDLGYGASYRDRLYLGFGLGIVSSNNTVVKDFTETETDPTTHLGSYTLHEDSKTTGTGINARIGAILRATDALRIGASIQTPTYMRMANTYNATITTTFNAQGNDAVPASLPIGTSSVDALPNDYDYAITTPLRANGGVAYTLGKHGFVTGDVEYVGYRQARLHSTPDAANGDSYSFTSQNLDIKSLYRNTVNLRFGAEGRFDVFRVRLGYARYGDPYYADTNNERVQNFYTAGAGIRQGNFFLDAAVVYTTFDRTYTPYSLAGQEPLIKVNNTRYTTAVTAGVTF